MKYIVEYAIYTLNNNFLGQMEKLKALALLKKLSQLDLVTNWHTVKALGPETFNNYHIVFFYYGGTNHLAIYSKCRQGLNPNLFVIFNNLKEFKTLQP